MKLSIRNQLSGTVTEITVGMVSAIVKMKLDGSAQLVTSSITKEALEDLGLEVGSKVTALVKSSEVSLAV
jgi:molybdopterin-binding protein